MQRAACGEEVETIISSIIKLAKEPGTNITCQGTDGANKWVLLVFTFLPELVIHLLFIRDEL